MAGPPKTIGVRVILQGGEEVVYRAVVGDRFPPTFREDNGAVTVSIDDRPRALYNVSEVKRVELILEPESPEVAHA